MFVALTFACTLMIQKHAQPDYTASVRALYPKIDQIFEKNDWNAASRMIAPNYVEDTADHRKIDKKTFMKEHIEGFKPMYDVMSSVKPIDIQTDGRTATVEVRYVVTSKFKDKKGPHSFKFEGSELHRWRKEHGQWLLGYIKEHDWTMSVDGKITQHAP